MAPATAPAQPAVPPKAGRGVGQWTIPAAGTALLLGAAGTLSLAHPAETPWLVGMALAGGAAGWLAPAGGWRLVALFLGLGAPVLAVRWPLDDAALPWLGMVLALAIAVPVRAGSVHYLAAWAALVAIAVAIRVPTAALPVAMAAAVVAVAAMAVDARIGAVRGAQGPARGRLLLIGLTLVALAPGLVPAMAGAPLLGPAEPPVRPARSDRPRSATAAGLDDRLEIGLGGDVSQDPQPAARLQWDPAEPPADVPGEGMHYLRARAFSRLVIDGGLLRWESMPGSTPVPGSGAADGPWSVVRRTGGGDVVLLPDGTVPSGLGGLLRDGEDAWFQPGIGRSIRTYMASPVEPLRARPETVAAARQLPAALDALPWSTIEDPVWATRRPRVAAAEIAFRLAERAVYRTTGLPESDATPADGLRRFLFGTPAERIGHCQYFATAAAVLLRRAGHAARCVVGYASDEAEPGSVVFRGWHAHAWIEVAEDGRWWRMDPTPPGPRRDGIDRIRENPELEEDEDLLAESATAAASAGGWPPAPGTVLAALALAAGIALAAGWLWRRRPADAAAKAARQGAGLLRLAAEAGIRVRAGTSVDAVAAELARRTGLDLDRHRAAHLSARFGAGAPPPPWPLGDLRRRLRGP